MMDLMDMMDTMDLMDMMDMMDPLLPTKFLSVAFAAYYLLVCTLLPESPQWRVKSTSFATFFMFKVCHQRIEGARASLRRLRGAGYPGVEIEIELQEIQKCREQETSQVIKNSVFEEIKSRTFYF